MEIFDTKAIPKPAPGAGTGLFATTNLHTGSNVLNVPASFATVLDKARLEDTCSNCFGTRSIKAEATGGQGVEGLKICTGCRVMKYCDKVSSCDLFPYLFTFVLGSVQGSSRSNVGRNN